MKALAVFLALGCLLLISAAKIKVGGKEYDSSAVTVDKNAMSVEEIPEYAAVHFQFSVSHTQGYRRKPLVGVAKDDIAFKYSSEDVFMDHTEAPFAVNLTEGFVQRHVIILVDMSESIFGNAGRTELMLENVNSLLDALGAAQLPGMLVAAYGFADVDSLAMVHPYTHDISLVRAAIAAEASMSRHDRVTKYGIATNFMESMFQTLDLTEKTLEGCHAKSPAAHVFIITDGNDNIRVSSIDQAKIRLKSYYERWSHSSKLDITIQPIYLTNRPDVEINTVMSLDFKPEPIDGGKLSSASTAYTEVAGDIAQDTPASYSVVICEAARDGAPRQQRDLLLQGHKILNYGFSPLGFTRHGAAKCDPVALLSKLQFKELEDFPEAEGGGQEERREKRPGLFWTSD